MNELEWQRAFLEDVPEGPVRQELQRAWHKVASLTERAEKAEAEAAALRDRVLRLTYGKEVPEGAYTWQLEKQAAEQEQTIAALRERVALVVSYLKEAERRYEEARTMGDTVRANQLYPYIANALKAYAGAAVLQQGGGE